MPAEPLLPEHLIAQDLTISGVPRQLSLDGGPQDSSAPRMRKHPDDLLRDHRRSSRLDPFGPYLERRWREGCRVVVLLFNELRQLVIAAAAEPCSATLLHGERPSHHCSAKHYRDCAH